MVRGIALDEIAGWINETALFRNQWGYRPDKARARPTRPCGSGCAACSGSSSPSAKAEGVLVPQVVYGYFPANADGDDLVIWTDETATEERCRFPYPRQADGAVPLHQRPVPARRPAGSTSPRSTSCTMGPEVTEAAAELKADDRYIDYLLLHGIGVEMTEALAELWHQPHPRGARHRRRRRPPAEDPPRPGLPGRPLLVGLPGLPRPRGQREGGRASSSADRIGIEVVARRPSWQYQPEQSTSALICHHPKAKYFVA